MAVCARVSDTHGEAIATARAVASAIPAILKIPGLRLRCDARVISPPYGDALDFPLPARLAPRMVPRVLQPRYQRNRAHGLFSRAGPIAILSIAGWARHRGDDGPEKSGT